MPIIAVFTILQIIIIWTATIVCYKSTKLNGGKEKKYILPYCILNSLVMIPLGLTEFIEIPIKFTYYIMFFFAFVEITFLPSYITSVIRKKINITIVVVVSIITFYILNLFNIPPSSILYLSCNIFITVYVFRYFIWLFTVNERLQLKETPHYWIIMGIFVCYTGSIPYFISELFLLKIGGFEVYNKLAQFTFLTYLILNICMYVFFIKSFKCKTKHQRSLSGQ